MSESEMGSEWRRKNFLENKNFSVILCKKSLFVRTKNNIFFFSVSKVTGISFSFRSEKKLLFSSSSCSSGAYQKCTWSKYRLRTCLTKVKGALFALLNIIEFSPEIERKPSDMFCSYHHWIAGFFVCEMSLFCRKCLMSLIAFDK